LRRVKGFVLAAGFGERMRPITEYIPKPLLPIGNLPLIGYALKLLAYHGITDVIVNLHHRGAVLQEALGDGSAYGVSITYSEEEEILGTGGGLKKMHEQLSDDTFVVVNSDTLLDVNLHAALAAHRERNALATMVLREDKRKGEFGRIEIDKSGRIRRILGHGGPDGESLSQDELEPFMFAGVHILEPRFLEYIPPDVNTCINRYAYTKALSNGELLGSFITEGYFADAGTPQRYFQTNVDAMEQRIELRHADPLGGFALAPRQEVAEVVRMGKDVELGDAVQITPPVLLGDGVRIGERAVIGPFPILQSEAHIGKDARVQSSIVLEGAKVDSDEHVDHRLVGRKVSLEMIGDAGEA
jgi:mannose-1-phosphate guanylyltransferase